MRRAFPYTQNNRVSFNATTTRPWKLKDHQRSYPRVTAMSKSSLKHKGFPRRHRVVTARAGAIQPSFDPYSQCTCDPVNLYGGIPLPLEWLVPLYHENGTTSSHLPECPQLRTVQSKTSRKLISLGMPASYLGFEEGDERKKSKAAKRKGVQDAETRAEAMKALEPIFNPYAQCCCDLLSYSDDEEATICRTHTDGSTSFHLPSCLTERYGSIKILKPYISSPESARYMDLEEKEQMKEVRKKKKMTRRQPKEPKSAAYINLEGEEEQGEDWSSFSSAKRYDSTTIASDFLRAIGEHPYLPPLNAHIDGFPTKKHGRASK